MAQLIYTPDEDVKVHEENAIKLICAAFQSHESGLPEWLKNSADAYAREDASETKRAIVVIFDYGRKGHISSISCLKTGHGLLPVAVIDGKDLSKIGRNSGSLTGILARQSPHIMAQARPSC